MGRVLLGDDDLGREMLFSGVRREGVTDLESFRHYIREHVPDAEDEGKRSIRAEEETGCRNWYEWRMRRWGSKWGAYEPTIAENATDTRADLEFWTAWSPPKPVVNQLSRKFPNLTFTLKYWEGGKCFRGILRVRAGTVLKDARYDYHGPRGG
jgi:hypothetical protein